MQGKRKGCQGREKVAREEQWENKIKMHNFEFTLFLLLRMLRRMNLKLWNL
jgi:hypothetical protein